MSDTAAYKAVVAEVYNCTADRALDLPVVDGNHAIAIHYTNRDLRWRFQGAPKYR